MPAAQDIGEMRESGCQQKTGSDQTMRFRDYTLKSEYELDTGKQHYPDIR